MRNQQTLAGHYSHSPPAMKPGIYYGAVAGFNPPR